jgi:16S rRNA pseudouridine516 synthase
MQSKRTRLDRFISKHLNINRKHVRELIAQARLSVDGAPAFSIHQLIDEFTQVTLDKKNLQHKKPVYLMMNKPTGVVSATQDAKPRCEITPLNGRADTIGCRFTRRRMARAYRA